MDDVGTECGHTARDFFLELRRKDGSWGEYMGFEPICEACARRSLEGKREELLSNLARSEPFREAWGSKSVPLRFRSRDGRIIDQGATVD